MKIYSRLHSFLSPGRKRKLLFNLKPSSLNKFTHRSSDTSSNTSFTNPNRECCEGKLSLEDKTPLCIKLPAKNYENQGRIYTGSYASVTTILDATRPKSNHFALQNWKRKLITDLGQDGYEEKVANLKSQGTSFHEAVKQYLSIGDKPELLESNKGHWESVSHVLSNIDQVIAVESVVVHPDLHYAGTLDGLVSFQGKLCLIDWKTSEKKRTSLKDCFSYPHQIVAYAGALNHDQNYNPIQVCSGLLVLAYHDGSPADTIWMSLDTCESYWNEWLLRVEHYYQLGTPSLNQKQGNTLKNLAQSIGGVPVIKQLQSEVISEEPANLEGLEYYNCFPMGSDPEWFESAVDVMEVDPSVVEYEDAS